MEKTSEGNHSNKLHMTMVSAFSAPPARSGRAQEHRVLVPEGPVRPAWRTGTSNSTGEEGWGNEPPWTCMGSVFHSAGLGVTEWFPRPCDPSTVLEACTSDALGIRRPALAITRCVVSRCTGNASWSFLNQQWVYFSIPIRKKWFVVSFLSLKKFEKMNTCRPNI